MIHFVTALDCEALPIIHRYGLKPCGSHGRARFFAGEKARLAVSGVGELRSAIATTALDSRFPRGRPLWLNVGIAGHRDAPLGHAFIANRVSSDSSRDVYFPQTVAQGPWPGIETRTLSAPSTNYQTERLFDREAYGFYTAALATATLEFVHVIKVVSDNAANPASNTLSKGTVSESIDSHLCAIETFAEEALKFQAIDEEGDWVESIRSEIRSNHHLSETERHRLNEKLKQLSHLLNHVEKGQFADQLIDRNKREIFEAIDSEIDSLSSQRICSRLG